MELSTPLQVVCGIVQKNERLLFLQRGAHQKHPLQWEFAGGKIEEGESPQAALCREWYEELNVEIIVGESLPSVILQQKKLHLELLPFYCQLVSNELTLTEHLQQAWWLPEEALKMNLSAGDRIIVERLMG